MKKSIILIAMMLLLTSCGPIQTTTQIGISNNNVDTTIGTSDTNIASSKISDYDISDFDFSAYFYDCYGDTTHKPTNNKYQGNIINEHIKQQLWNIICTQEMQELYNSGSVGGSNCAELYLTNKKTDEKFTIYYSIWYSNPELDGGPLVMAINNNYYEITPNDCTSISDDFYYLIGQAIMNDDNLQSSSDVNTTLGENNSTLDKNDRRTEIVLVNQYTNWASEYQNYGYFVTMYGDVYEFDFSKYEEIIIPNEKIDFLSYLEDIMENGQISRFEDVSKVIAPLQDIQVTNSWKTNSNGDDMGQNTFYGVRSNSDNSDMEVIKLYSYGDSIDILQDINAQKVCESWLGNQFITR